MAEFQQFDDLYAMSLTTFKLTKVDRLPKEHILHVPWYFWRQWCDQEEHVNAVYKKHKNGRYSVKQHNNTVRCNNLSIQFEQGYRLAFIKFFNKSKGVWMNIEMCVTPTLIGMINRMGHPVRDLFGMKYRVAIDGTVKEYDTEFYKRVDVLNDFCSVYHLGSYTECSRLFNYGILHDKYDASYNGKMFFGWRYALLSGPWGILLSDSFEFDSLVILKSCRNNTLEIDKFVYTVNPQVLKVMMFG